MDCILTAFFLDKYNLFPPIVALKGNYNIQFIKRQYPSISHLLLSIWASFESTDNNDNHNNNNAFYLKVPSKILKGHKINKHNQRNQAVRKKQNKKKAKLPSNSTRIDQYPQHNSTR